MVLTEAGVIEDRLDKLWCSFATLTTSIQPGVPSCWPLCPQSQGLQSANRQSLT